MRACEVGNLARAFTPSSLLLCCSPPRPVSTIMSNGHTLRPVSGHKESVGGLLDNDIYPSRFAVAGPDTREGREREGGMGRSEKRGGVRPGLCVRVPVPARRA